MSVQDTNEIDAGNSARSTKGAAIVRMSDTRRLTEAELAEVNGGVTASTMAYIHSVFSASASDLIFGGKGFVAEVASDVAKGYR